MTPTTPLLIIFAILFRYPPRVLIFSLLPFMCFSNSAVFVAGRLNVSVGWAILIICGLRCVTSMPVPDSISLSRYARSFGFLWLLFLYAVLLIFLCPILFSGSFMIMPGSSLFKPELAIPYDFVSEMATQSVYFFVALAATFPIFLVASRMEYDDLASLVDRSFWVAGMFTGLVAVWHFLSNETGIYFPDSFFHNERSAGAWDQGYVGGVRRVSGPAAEPSALAAYTAIFLYYSCARLVRFELKWAILAALSFFVLMISTSTTAYGLLAVLFVLIIIYATTWVMFVPSSRTLAIAARTVGAFVLVALVALGYFAINFDQYKGLIDFTLDKGSTSSAYERGYANDLSYDILAGTFGLGAGIGAHRASGLFFTLIASVGIPGLVLYALYTFSILQVLLIRTYYSHPKGLTIIALGFALLGGLVPGLIAASNLIDPLTLVGPCFVVALRSSFSRMLIVQSQPTHNPGVLLPEPADQLIRQ